MLDVPFNWIRTLDLSTFTGDAWGLEASLAVPPAAVPRFIASGSFSLSIVDAMREALSRGRMESIEPAVVE